jgi:hypothetical protein
MPIALRIDVCDFARRQGNHDREANLHYKKYVIYSGHSRLLLSLSGRARITQGSTYESFIRG